VPQCAQALHTTIIRGRSPAGPRITGIRLFDVAIVRGVVWRVQARGWYMAPSRSLKAYAGAINPTKSPHTAIYISSTTLAAPSRQQPSAPEPTGQRLPHPAAPAALSLHAVQEVLPGAVPGEVLATCACHVQIEPPKIAWVLTHAGPTHRTAQSARTPRCARLLIPMPRFCCPSGISGRRRAPSRSWA